jgi:DedD protein
MEARLRNRIVGAVILASLAVIFVPMILTGEGELDLTPRGPTIPPEPEMTGSSLLPTLPADPVPPAENARPIVLETHVPEAESVSPPPESAAVAPDAPPPIAAVLEPAQEPARVTAGVAAWAVQVGSFGVKKSAFALRDQLRAKGYAAYVEAVKSGTASVYRVRVGPELQEELAQSLKERIAKDTGSQGLVVRHNQ